MLKFNLRSQWITGSFFFFIFALFGLFVCLEMQSVVRQNLHSETEADINKLINLKLNASYTYLALVRFIEIISVNRLKPQPSFYIYIHIINSQLRPPFLQGMYFDRDDVALPRFSCFFLERSVKEREQAEKLLEYQNLRGGRILLQTIAVSTACSRPPKNSSFLGLSY